MSVSETCMVVYWSQLVMVRHKVWKCRVRQCLLVIKNKKDWIFKDAENGECCWQGTDSATWCSLYNRVPTLVRNLGNRWEFDLGYSQLGIGWELVFCAKWLGIHTQNILVGKMISEIIPTFWEKKGKSLEFCFWKVMGIM